MNDYSDICFKLPLYWWKEWMEEMPADDIGRMIKSVFIYANGNVEPCMKNATPEIKRAWAICKRDIDYQKDHPRTYRYPEDERKAIRNSGKYNEWRKAVFERDDYTCQSCGQRGGMLNAHHIKHFASNPDERLNPDNGITLCKDCHRGVHRGEIVLDWM